MLLASLDALAGPAPAVDGTPDPRTPAERRHDGFEAALRLVLRAKDLPDVAGTVATVLLTATVDQWDSDTGLITTGHGSLISVTQAKQIAGGDPLIVPVVIGHATEILAYGTAHRLFRSPQRCAIYARDKGCTWPGCDTPALWCEINHVTPWAHGGRTCVDNGALLCPRHHQNLDFNDWTPTMINGTPHYTPPTQIDPDQTPRRNTLHDTVDIELTRCRGGEQRSNIQIETGPGPFWPLASLGQPEHEIGGAWASSIEPRSAVPPIGAGEVGMRRSMRI